jgi:hypothetical protein
LRMMPLHWLPFCLRLKIVYLGFVTCNDPQHQNVPIIQKK